MKDDNAVPSREQMIETLWTRAEIERVMLNFGRALDVGDWKLYRSCFADRFKVNFERLIGPAVYRRRGFAGRASRRVILAESRCGVCSSIPSNFCAATSTAIVASAVIYTGGYLKIAPIAVGVRLNTP